MKAPGLQLKNRPDFELRPDVGRNACKIGHSSTAEAASEEIIGAMQWQPN
jgi:hypothetical protein